VGSRIIPRLSSSRLLTTKGSEPTEKLASYWINKKTPGSNIVFLVDSNKVVENNELPFQSVVLGREQKNLCIAHVTVHLLTLTQQCRWDETEEYMSEVAPWSPSYFQDMAIAQKHEKSSLLIQNVCLRLHAGRLWAVSKLEQRHSRVPFLWVASSKQSRTMMLREMIK